MICAAARRRGSRSRDVGPLKAPASLPKGEPMGNADYFRDSARRYRRLAEAITDAKALQALMTLADEFEAKAASIDATLGVPEAETRAMQERLAD